MMSESDAGEAMGMEQESGRKHSGSFLQDEIERRWTAFGEELQGTASDFRELRDRYRQSGKIFSAFVTNAMANRFDDAAAFVTHADVTTFSGKFDGLSRRVPVMAAAAAVTGGLAIARVIRRTP